VGCFEDVTRLCSTFIASIGKNFEPCDQLQTISRPLSFSHVLRNYC